MCRILFDFNVLNSLLLNMKKKLSLTTLFKANNIHNTEIAWNAALPVIRLHGNQQNGEDDNDSNDNESDHGPRTWGRWRGKNSCHFNGLFFLWQFQIYMSDLIDSRVVQFTFPTLWEFAVA